jgi:hypothetical protein
MSTCAKMCLRSWVLESRIREWVMHSCIDDYLGVEVISIVSLV